MWRKSRHLKGADGRAVTTMRFHFFAASAATLEMIQYSCYFFILEACLLLISKSLIPDASHFVTWWSRLKLVQWRSREDQAQIFYTKKTFTVCNLRQVVLKRKNAAHWNWARKRRGKNNICIEIQSHAIGAYFCSLQFLPIVCLHTNYCYGFLYELQFLHVVFAGTNWLISLC